MDAAVVLVGAEGPVGGAGAEAGQGLAFPVGVLASVLVEFDRAEAGGQAGEGAAGVDLGELVVVADEHDFGVGGVGVVEEFGELAGTDDRGLVDHDDVV